MVITIESLLKEAGVYLDNITVNGVNTLIDYYLTPDENSTIFHYQDEDQNTIASLDIKKQLIPKILSKGVFEIEDEITKQKVSIQFYKATPLEVKTEGLDGT